VTVIQQVLWQCERDYLGHPYYVTGNALYQALARRVDAATRRQLCVSHGVFVPGEYGQYPEEHSQSGGVAYMGTGLRPVNAYDDLFLFRHAPQRWLLDSRPRDAHNTHTVHSHGGRQALAPTRIFGRPAEHRATKRTMTWYVHAYLHGDGDDTGGPRGARSADAGAATDHSARDAAADSVVPLAETTLDEVQVGGARNYGFGELSVADTQVIDLTALDYTRLSGDEPDQYVLELVTPYVLASECPGADDQSVPWWWATPPLGASGPAGVGADTAAGLRRRPERLVAGDRTHELATVDHGQLVEYAGDRPVETAINGILRVGTHAKVGFGEIRVWPVTAGDGTGHRGAGVTEQETARTDATTTASGGDA
jgi:hypothetical protein